MIAYCQLRISIDCSQSAYIAASRRSDRSLEARVESARRASEIHKRRTGRSLRVTEQDVINEEMYEEEDDDLPMQYRRLTAHLQTGSVDFNRRLHAYLTNQVAMRSALDQAITNSYAQQYPNAPQFAHNQNTYPSPFMPQTFSQQQPQHSPTSYQPYPSPGSASYRPGQHGRSMSDSVGNSTFPPTGMPAPSPRPSVAGIARRRTSGSSNKSSSHSPVNTKSTPLMQPRSVADKPSPTSNNLQDDNANHRKTSQQSSPHLQYITGLPNTSMSPFSTSLSTEAQMLLGNSLDPHDPMTAMMMAGSEHHPQPWNYNNHNSAMSMKPRDGFNPGHDGMSATLAPSALDMSQSNQQFSGAPSSMSMSSSANPDGLHLNAFDSSMNDFSKSQPFGGNSSGGSGVGTPSIEGGWEAYINDNSWSDGQVT